MRLHLTNLGCKLNQAEMEDLARRASADGHEIVASLEAADVHVVNSCTVTQAAARTSRKTARRAHRLRDGSDAGPRTVLTGCYVDGCPDEAARLAGVDLIVPNRDKDLLLESIYRRFPEWRPRPAERIPVPYVPLAFGNSRALLKIEDGCNMGCTFCIIPATRGRQRSLPADGVVDEARRLGRAGFREVVGTGVQISAYRDGATRLAGLVRRLLDETEVERFRLTSIAPWDFDPRLLDLVETGRVCRHFHLSLQSGCDATLRRMRRPYDGRTYRELVDRIRRRLPGVAITTDVIVGFPGESEEEFRRSLDFVAATRFAKIHAFPYSPRPGTVAADLPDQVPPAVRRERMDRLLAAAAGAERDFVAAQVGRTLPVLWERKRGRTWQGTSDNYVKVSSASGARGRKSPELGELLRSLTPTLIEGLTDDSARGRPLVPAPAPRGPGR